MWELIIETPSFCTFGQPATISKIYEFKQKPTSFQIELSKRNFSLSNDVELDKLEVRLRKDD